MSVPGWLDWAADHFIDGVQVVSTVATCVAVVIAVITIRQSAKNSNANQKALIRERQIDFELGVLSELVELLPEASSLASSYRMSVLAQMVPAKKIPLTAAAAGLDSTPAGKARVLEVCGTLGPQGDERAALRRAPRWMLDEMTTELLEAINALVQDRGDISVAGAGGSDNSESA